jgi:hypothetical protein
MNPMSFRTLLCIRLGTERQRDEWQVASRFCIDCGEWRLGDLWFSSEFFERSMKGICGGAGGQGGAQ